MTEAEWLASDDLPALLAFISDTTSDRKQRLVSCAYSRLVGHRLCAVGRSGVETAERWADGEVSDVIADAALKQVQALIPDDGKPAPYSPVAWALTWGARGSSYPPWYGANLAALNVQELLGAASDLLAHFIRDIFGNPFRPVAFDPAWRSESAVSLARTMYETRDFSPMPILADALQDAGCDNADILAHCRAPGPHVRGCWVVDLVLNKE
jgi:hypothetical protein